MSKLDDVIGDIKKKYGKSIVGTLEETKRDYKSVPFATPAMSYLFRGGMPRTIIELLGENNVGKAQPMYSKVLTETGWKEFKDIRLFDDIYCEDGKLHKVIGVFPQGEKDIYEVEFTDGKVFRCCDEHLFEYRTHKITYNGSRRTFTRPLKGIIEDFKQNPKLQATYIFTTNACTDFSVKDFSMPPYIVGLFLGDGHINSHCMQFINNEEDILQTMIDYGISVGCKVTVAQKVGCKCITYSKPDNYAGNKKDPTVIKKLLKQLGLCNTLSHTKFIPKEYFLGSKEQRLELLAGLVNTDGYLNASTIRYSTVSRQLKDDVIELARSLGFMAKEIATDIRDKGKHPCYNISILEFQDLIPYLSDKHKSRYVPSSQINRVCIKTIKYIGKDECQCIYVDNPTHLYITDNYVVTHNTTLAYSLCGSAQKVLEQEYNEEVEQLQALTKPKAEEKERLTYLLQRGKQKVCYIDHEYSSDHEWMLKNGIDLDELIFIQPDGQTAEQIFQMIIDLVGSDGIGCMVLDSIPALVSQQAAEKDMEQKTMAGISAPLSQFCSKFMPIQKKHGCLFIGINNVRDDMAGYNRIISPGGKFWKNTCSVRLLFKKDGYYDSKYADLKAHPESAFGNYVQVEVLKNKVCSPDRRMTRFSISYNTGIDGFNDTINLAVTHGLVKKSGAWFSIQDEEGNAKVHENGDTMKWQGLANVIKYMQEHEEVYNEVREAVEYIIKNG